MAFGRRRKEPFPKILSTTRESRRERFVKKG